MERLVLIIIKLFLKLFYRVEVRGLENYNKLGKRALILANHQSFLDPVLLAAFLPEKPSFAINTQIARLAPVRAVLSVIKVFKIDPTNPISMKSLIEYVEEDRKVVIFPEGRITITGSLMKVYEGPGLVADKTGADILPVYIENAEYSKFSRLKGKVKRKWFPKIRITILPPTKLEAKSTGRERRAEIANNLQKLMSELQFRASNYNRPVIASVIDASKKYGVKKVIAEDMQRSPMNYRALFLKSIALSAALDKAVKGENVGVLLPNALANLVTIFSLHRLGKIPAMLNYSAGSVSINSACKAAEVKTIICSRAFVEKGGLQELISELTTNIIYLEDIAKNISKANKIRALLLSRFPKCAFKKALAQNANSPAFILFTSGSEGVPKGVALSHANLSANIQQARSVIDFSERDILLNALPMFHSFGLTAGSILPIFSGIKVFLYPSPLHYNIIPEIAYAIQATVLFGTDTFLSRYAKAAHPYDFYALRYVISGAEKLKDPTQKFWNEKFGKRILQGYGVTEASPALSFNTPIFNKHGSVGKMMPGIEYKLVPVEGISDGGELWVKGPNIMLGYLKADKPGVLQPPENGWYGTGDIVTIDAEGYIFIVGRAKRFAKIAGEMVSLPMVEEFISKIWPGELAAVIATKDERKGEQIVLVVENKNLALEDMRKAASTHGIPEIAVPRRMEVMPIPLMGSGKIDYPMLEKKLAEMGITQE